LKKSEESNLLKEESAEYTKPLERDWRIVNLLLLDDLTQLVNTQGTNPWSLIMTEEACSSYLQ
jgi:UDP-N-acetyl-D-mannosaminuronate dehydrogenase